MFVCNNTAFAYFTKKDEEYFTGHREWFDERIRPLVEVMRSIKGVIPTHGASGLTGQEVAMNDPDYPNGEDGYTGDPKEMWSLTFVVSEEAKHIPEIISESISSYFTEDELDKRSIVMSVGTSYFHENGKKVAFNVWGLEGFIRDGYESATHYLWDCIARHLREYIGEVVYETTSE